MKATEFLKENLNKILLGFCIILMLVFFKECQSSSRVSDLKKTNVQLQLKVDSLTIEVKGLRKSQVSKEEYQRIAEKTMYQFLIFEEDVDKGRISLSEIQLKLKEDAK